MAFVGINAAFFPFVRFYLIYYGVQTALRSDFGDIATGDEREDLGGSLEDPLSLCYLCCKPLLFLLNSLSEQLNLLEQLDGDLRGRGRNDCAVGDLPDGREFLLWLRGRDLLLNLPNVLLQGADPLPDPLRSVHG